MSELQLTGGVVKNNGFGMMIKNGIVYHAFGGNAGGLGAAELYEALQYSGLVTPEMSVEEMLEVLAAEYPEVIDLYISSRTKGAPSNTAADATTSRAFDFNSYIVGISSLNTYNTSAITLNSISDEKIMFTNNGFTGFGVGLPIHLVAGRTYRLSCDKNSDIATGIGFLFYTNNGSFISWSGMAVNNYEVEVPSNAYYTVLLFYSQQGSASFSNIQLKPV